MGSRFEGLGYMVYGSGFKVEGGERGGRFKVSGIRFRVKGIGFRVLARRVVGIFVSAKVADNFIGTMKQVD